EAVAARTAALADRGEARRALSALARLTGLVAGMPFTARDETYAVQGWPPHRLRSVRTHVRALLAGTLPEDPSVYADLRAEVAGLGPLDVRRRAQADLKRSLILIGDGHVDEGLAYAGSALRTLPPEHRTTAVVALARRVCAAIPASYDETPSARLVRALTDRGDRLVRPEDGVRWTGQEATGAGGGLMMRA
ncbi:hypothetical protein, partial [Actinomadura fibrosa]